MADGDKYFWANATNDGSQATAWRKNDPLTGTNEVPSAGAILHFETGSTSWTAGLTTTKTGTNAFRAIIVKGGPDGYKGNIGTSSTALDADFDTGTSTLAGQGNLYKFDGDFTGTTVVRSTSEKPNPVKFNGDVSDGVVLGGFVEKSSNGTCTFRVDRGRLYVRSGCTFTSLTAVGPQALVITEETPLTLVAKAGARVRSSGADDFTTVTLDGATLEHTGRGNMPIVTSNAGVIDCKLNPYDIDIGSDGTSSPPTGSTYTNDPNSRLIKSAVGGTVTVSNNNPIGGGGVVVDNPLDDSQVGAGRDSTTIGGGDGDAL